MTTYDELFERLEEVVGDLVYMKVKPKSIRSAVDDEIAKTVERCEADMIERNT